MAQAGAGVASCTPLFAATWCGMTNAAKVMLEEGADPKLGDSEKRTPMDIAETDELKALLQVIRERVICGWLR